MIEVRELTKRYRSVTAVDALSFDVRPGVVTGFLGPNGAGKSTTMRMIVGLDRPTSGSVTVGGRPYRQLRRPLHEVGAVLDTASLHGGRSAYHHVLCLAQSNGIGARRVVEVLDLVGLGEVARRRAGTFSLGMRQRLAMAVALLGDPPVLLCDEPINGLDPEGIRWIRGLLRALAVDGRTVFVSSHLMSEMALTADHVVVVGRGRLVADASVSDIIDRGSARSVLVRTPQTARLRSALLADGLAVGADEQGQTLTVTGVEPLVVGGVAARCGIALQELRVRQASLEEAFMNLTRDSVEFRPESGPERGHRR